MAAGTNSSDDYVVLGGIAGFYTEKHFVSRLAYSDLSKYGRMIMV